MFTDKLNSKLGQIIVNKLVTVSDNFAIFECYYFSLRKYALLEQKNYERLLTRN